MLDLEVYMHIHICIRGRGDNIYEGRYIPCLDLEGPRRWGGIDDCRAWSASTLYTYLYTPNSSTRRGSH